MPIYEYKCMDCEKEFEALVLGSDGDMKCPECKSGNLKRLMSACGFKSNGSFTPSTGSSGCASCTSSNCSSCH
ncbi:MAG: zinc ribbon domain-containing protein [Deltaproteobacteria bacterium]|nr:MAG: zinc ribbon domain-containing protein [Deltaproteobacteria bacterium]